MTSRKPRTPTPHEARFARGEGKFVRRAIAKLYGCVPGATGVLEYAIKQNGPWQRSYATEVRYARCRICGLSAGGVTLMTSYHKDAARVHGWEA